MRDSSNPVMRGVVRDNQSAGGYAGFGTGAAGVGQAAMYNQYGQQVPPYTQQPTTTTRQLTIDDVVTKTAITLGVLTISAIAAYFLVSANEALAMPLFGIGAIVGLVLVLIASFGRKQDNPAIVLGYAVFEGLFVGSISYVFANWMVSGTSAGALIGQAVLGTFGVFFGMLLVYKVGAIRVTPRFTRMLFAGLIGVIVLMVGNLIMSLFTGGAGILRDGGPIAIIFSLVCIALAAFSFLVDFDAADRLIRAGAPDRAAWGVALGLTVTLVWLYVEILRLLSYFQSD
ncbi:Bax inhibitor-1/YccA family protein [Gordonia polyisoprenivorans]|uniref:Bax inhibitor-1/YccA family protein n=1 Tax=Gordonia polyisoprenivorans TaxID=84595 RepID=UPI001AD61150|nr:Bax inhibitor-1/YccA family protein [Gordonia polyisoprenivorans]QTI71039.1 Bax inhibitor-1/YccA family protein [Gordonia polyisoprenivorans]